jgi:hypothetical protein
VSSLVQQHLEDIGIGVGEMVRNKDDRLALEPGQMMRSFEGGATLEEPGGETVMNAPRERVGG